MVYLGPLSPMPGDDITKLGPHLIGAFLQAPTPELRERALWALRDLLPPSIRVYDHEGLHVFYDHTVSEEMSLLKWLMHAASYVEMRYPDGHAEVKKGGFGPVAVRSREPLPKSAIDRLLEDDDLV